MEYVVGTIIAVAVAGVARIFGLDKGRSFYPTVLIVVASYYSLFAAMGASGRVITTEAVIGLGFAILAVFGFKRNMWLVGLAIAGHGVFDLMHHSLIDHRGVPVWWPGFCATVDLILGGWLVASMLRKVTSNAVGVS